MDKTWAEYIAKSTSKIRQKRTFTQFNKYQVALKPIFRKYCFKLKVFEGFLRTIDPLQKEIIEHFDNLNLAEKARTKKHRSINTRKILNRLKKIEDDMSIDPKELVRIIQEVRKGMRHAHRAKTEMVEANLRLVISIAKRGKLQA